MDSLESALFSSKSINRFAITLTAAVVLLCLSHIVFVVWIPDSPDLIQNQVNVDLEGNWATWCNSTLNLLTGLVALLVAWLSTHRGQKSPNLGWILAAGIFIYLSMDDATGIHDGLAGKSGELIDWLGITNPVIQDYKHSMWIVVLGVPGLIVVLVMMRLLSHDVWHVPNARRLIIVGFLLLISNPLTEMVEVAMIRSAGYESFPGLQVLRQEQYAAWQRLQWVTVFQEATEMVAVILFAASFLYAGQSLSMVHQDAGTDPHDTVQENTSSRRSPRGDSR